MGASCMSLIPLAACIAGTTRRCTGHRRVARWCMSSSVRLCGGTWTRWTSQAPSPRTWRARVCARSWTAGEQISDRRCSNRYAGSHHRPPSVPRHLLHRRSIVSSACTTWCTLHASICLHNCAHLKLAHSGCWPALSPTSQGHKGDGQEPWGVEC